MTIQEMLLDIGLKAEQIRQSSESYLNPPARDAAIQITITSARLQTMHSTIIEALRKIATADLKANSEDMRLVAQAALQAVNE